MDGAKSLIKSNPYPKWAIDVPFDKLCEVTGRSFAGSETAPEEPIVSYILRGILPEHGDPERIDVYKFIMSFAVEANKRRGAIHFGHPGEGSQQRDLRSCVIIRECDPEVEFARRPRRWHNFRSSFVDFWLYVKAQVQGKVPAVFRDLTNMRLAEARGIAVGTALEGAHKLHGPKDKHIYVFAVGTDPDYQGKGYGKQLMNQISQIADAASQACYLECAGDKNKSFYEKFGYRVVKEQLLKDEKDDTELLVYLMIRPSNA